MLRMIKKFISIGLGFGGVVMILTAKDDINFLMGTQAILMSDLIDLKLDSEMQSLMLAKLYKKQFPEDFKDEQKN